MIKVYHYFGRFGKDFSSILKNNKIKYHVSYAPNDLDPIYSFDLKCPSSTFDSQYAAISLFVKPLDIRIEYSKIDLENAKLIAIRPKRQCISILNYDNAMLYLCSKSPYFSGSSHIHDQTQVGLLQIDRIPKQTKAAFCSEDTGYEFLFCDNRVYSTLYNSNIRGVSFNPVISKKGSAYSDFYQVTSENKISRRALLLGHGERYDYCPFCGEKKIVLSNTDQIYLDMNSLKGASDFYVTESIFGEGIAYPFYIISQRCFKLLRDSNLLFHVVCIPVVC